MNIKNIKNPKFLKNYNIKELEELSLEVRSFLINSLSKTGGHLSSNLGIVDLTIALHKNFDFDKDKIIFDVGHQCYTHKILTGRANKFNTLRQTNGLSGFQSRNESKYDCYEAGHSSTSLSAALGFACARKHINEYHVVAVIGDGSMGNGVSYEALNNIGNYDKPLIILLNDNEMSINENVGALHNALDKLRSKKSYKNTKKNTKNILQSIPFIGGGIVKIIHNTKKGIKTIYNKNSIFDKMGIKYYGPINGHDYKELDLYLNIAKKEKKPVLLHVITEKGKGFKYAENDKYGKWHGAKPFDIETGEFLNINTNTTSWSEIISDELIQIRKHNNKLCVITPAMTSGAKLNKFKKLYPKSFYDTGITESHSLIFASALGLEGKIPFISIYSTFLQRAYDQVIHDIARMNSHVVIGVDRAGLVGSDGVSHQGIYDLSFLIPIPNIIISHPKNEHEAKIMLKNAIKHNGPSVIRYSKNNIKKNNIINTKSFDIGTWEIIRKGINGTIISYGDFLRNAEIIAVKLNLNLINARYIKPIDKKIWNQIKKDNNNIYIYEESTEIGSLGSYLKNITNYSKIFIFGIPDEFIPHGNNEDLYKSYKLDVKSIIKRINNIEKRSK